MGSLTGINGEVWLYTSLTLIVTIAAFIVIYRMDTEFYENVIAGTELKSYAKSI